MRVLVLASLAWSLVNFRGRLLRDMVEAGHDVIASAPEDDPAIERQLAAMGVGYRRIAMERTATDPLDDLRLLGAYVRLMKAERPDVILAYTQKPIIWGGIAARIAGGARFFAMVSGLGHVFSADGGRGLRAVVARLYRAAVARAEAVFVFNSDDRAEMLRHGMIRPGHTVVQVPGSGIDTRAFPAQPLPGGPPVFLLVGRMLRDKGLAEFVAAAASVRAEHPQVRLQLLGPLDPNPTGIGRDEIDRWVASGAVEYLGETRDVGEHLARATVFVLPSYYREGLPRTILEAMASGRAVITTDAPGCREAVRPGENGFLVPVRDAAALAGAMLRFVLEPALAARMGGRSRAIAESEYAVEIVNALLLRTMGLTRAQLSRPRLRAVG